MDCDQTANLLEGGKKRLCRGGCRAGFGVAPGIAIIWMLLLLLFASGCTTSPRDWFHNGFKVGPNYARPPAPVADAWIDIEDTKLTSDTADDAQWWKVFDDPVLDELVQTAYEENLPLKIAGMRVLEARAQRGVATGNLFPQQQQVTGYYTRNELSDNGFPFGTFAMPRTTWDAWSAKFDAAWELDFWGRFRRAIESADANLNARIEAYDDALVILQAEVAATYIEMRTMEERLALARKNVELQRETLRITQVKFENGTVSKLDVRQAQSILSATESLIPVLKMGRRKAQNRLCTLMGMPPQDLEEILGRSGTIPAAPPEVAVGIPAELLRRRPDVQRAEREAAAQCARIGIAESEFYPRIAITGNIAVESQYLNQLFDTESIAAAIGPSFRWNILNYGRIRNNVLAEDIRFRQLVLQYQETVLRANEEAENAITNFLREQERVKSLEEGTKATDEARKLAKIQYDAGKMDFLRLLDSQRALVNQQDALAQARGNVALNLVALYKALGGGWQMRLQSTSPEEEAALEGAPEAAPANRSQPSDETPELPKPSPPVALPDAGDAPAATP